MCARPDGGRDPLGFDCQLGVRECAEVLVLLAGVGGRLYTRPVPANYKSDGGHHFHFLRPDAAYLFVVCVGEQRMQHVQRTRARRALEFPEPCPPGRAQLYIGPQHQPLSGTGPEGWQSAWLLHPPPAAGDWLWADCWQPEFVQEVLSWALFPLPSDDVWLPFINPAERFCIDLTRTTSADWAKSRRVRKHAKDFRLRWAPPLRTFTHTASSTPRTATRCAPQPQHCTLHGRERAARSDWQCIGLSTRSISHDYDSSLRALIEYHRERGSTWFSDRLHRLFCTMARDEQSPLKHR